MQILARLLKLDSFSKTFVIKYLSDMVVCIALIKPWHRGTIASNLLQTYGRAPILNAKKLMIVSFFTKCVYCNDGVNTLFI